MNRSSKQITGAQVLWVQVWSLALVQGAIALMWVIYNLYLIDLLTQLGFPAALATGLLIVENVLAMVMEPLMGSLSDRLQQQIGSKFPLVSLGVILAAGVFLSLPVMAIGGLNAAQRWILPLMLVAWALAMTLFRSPALSLLGRYAIRTRLPQAASILTLVGGVAGAMGPLASEQILQGGPVAAFALGSGVLLLATLALRFNAPQTSVAAAEERTIAPPAAVSWSSLALVFGTGVGVTVGFRSLMLLFSRVMNSRVPNGSASLVLGTIFVILALTAIPAGTLALRIGNRRAMLLGLAALAFVCVTVSVVSHMSSAIALAVLFGAAFSLVANGTLPFALSMVPSPKAGLGTGMFFSGGAAAASLLGSVMDPLKAQPLTWLTVLGLLGLLLAASCITCAPRHLAATAN